MAQRGRPEHTPDAVALDERKGQVATAVFACIREAVRLRSIRKKDCPAAVEAIEVSINDTAIDHFNAHTQFRLKLRAPIQ